MTVDARDEVERFILGDRFACLAGRSAWRKGGITHRHYDLMGSDDSARLMALDLADFVDSADWSHRSFTSFIATFERPRGVDELRFEELLWEQLQLLHEQDSRSYRWAAGRSSDPQAREFAYSVAGHPFFVIGLHETHRRWGRRPPFPMLAFNSHEQFDRIKAAEMWDRLAEKIRKQDIQLQGDINPNLLEYEELSEARRYSGRPKPADWQCPFTAREGEREPALTGPPPA
ncbi:guanitoxin biosynthesis heme-dependent pre-guanitoxin N-hydroxylase GntA [Streptomyces malaysiensis]|uniref:guanitoxin biosynthesis heme-dependent pre-guanitoxin N-hydroxylase GntA n=1 Tax=Streptomyces malaysiensis TaxID=92644 RepID=UPI0024BFF046|nr:guanitoxin biosynthesis heme-dependent pre-guanitoxin N-hydroxylase GntA [Streptomyces sp. NA07423]WHX20636.1 guanitoxin biosynthesis heme-dependent pre-guanitoxin N-hydroxylase GntA [Streptomyces sp. NA07423]